MPALYAGAAMMLALLLSWLTYHYIEVLLRFRWRTSRAVALLSVTMISIGVLGLVTGHGRGIDERAIMTLNLGSFACPPFRGLEAQLEWSPGAYCREVVEHAYAMAINTPSIDTVVLAFAARGIDYWGVRGVPRTASRAARLAALAPSILADVDALRAAGKQVVVSYDIPYLPMMARDCLPRPGASLLAQGYDQCRQPQIELEGRRDELALYRKLFAARPEICQFRQAELLFEDGRLRLTDAAGRLLMRDDHHLSSTGSRRMAALLWQRCAIGEARR